MSALTFYVSILFQIGHTPVKEKPKRRFSGKKVILPLILLLVVAGILGYRYRGAIRLKMLEVLHSFDDVPEQTDPLLGDVPPGLWGEARDISVEEQLTPEQQEALEEIESLGYLSGYHEAPDMQGVVLYDSTRAFQGYNIFMSGHGPGVIMTDMYGNIVHEWYNPEVSVYGLWPEAQDTTIEIDIWRRVHLFDNGDILVLIEGGGVVRLDSDSDLLWASDYNGAHHSFCVDEVTGRIYVLGRNIHINPRYDTENLTVEDYVCILDSMGNEIESITILDALEASRYAPVLRKTPGERDVLHCNTIDYVGFGDLPEGYRGPFRENSLILSSRTHSLICAMELEGRDIYWAESDLWWGQHQPSLLDNGDLLVFDNCGYGESSSVQEFSQNFDEIVWFYRGTTEEPFYTRVIGSCHRLPNGNTLIIESMQGRAFEVTKDKEIVWEYYNPNRAGDENELIASLYDVVRVRSECVDQWLLE
jgi:hypothetical protein